MKVACIFFIAFFVLFFIIGLIVGIRTERDKNEIYASAVKHLRLDISEGGVVLFFNNKNGPVYKYDVKGQRLNLLTDKTEFNAARSLFPMDLDQLVLGTLVGSAGVLTVRGLMKLNMPVGAAEAVPNAESRALSKAEEAAAKSKSVNAVVESILGGFRDILQVII